MSSPGSECRSLQGSAEGECEDPWFGQRAVVDGIEVKSGLLFTLTTREKSYSCGGKTTPFSFGFCKNFYMSVWNPLQVSHPSGLPGTAGGTVRRMAVRVAIATSSRLYLVGQLCPAVTMLGLRRVPSRYT